MTPTLAPATLLTEREQEVLAYLGKPAARD
jgi:hypothetical protein